MSAQHRILGQGLENITTIGFENDFGKQIYLSIGLKELII